MVVLGKAESTPFCRFCYFSSMKKLILVFCICLVTFSCRNENKEPWNNNQLIDPFELSESIIHNKSYLIYSIGPAAIIKNSIDIGETRHEENLNKLKKKLASNSNKSEIIFYCGCCPFNDCPNIRPAFSLANSLGFKNHKLLNLANNLKSDWIDKNYPIQQID